MAATIATRSSKKPRVEAASIDPHASTLSLDIIEPTPQSMLALPHVMDPFASSWASFNIGQTATPSAFLPPTSGYDQPSRDPFSMSDFLETGAPYGTPQFEQSMFDYFNLDPIQAPEAVAPQDLTNQPATSAPVEAVPPPPQQVQPSNPQNPVKVPKKRGRKRKQLDEKSQAMERKKFLERNRVAANRCRERKKTYVSNLETKQKEILAKNQFLRHELESLNDEVTLLKQMVFVKCACSEDVLVQNLRAGLEGTTQSPEDVEEVVANFKSMRAAGVTASFGLEAPMKVIKSRTPSTASSLSAQEDDLFSLVGDADDHPGSSAQSSPIEYVDRKDD